MPRSFDLTAESPNTAERIHSAFSNETYWHARLSEFGSGNPRLESLTTGPAGVTTVTVTVRFGMDRLPAPMDRLHQGTLRIVQVECWRAAEHGVLLGTITVDAPGAPVSGHGELSITPVAGGSRMVGRGTVDVRVPVIGGAIAGLVAAQLASSIRDIHDFTDSWIARDDRR